MADRKRLIRKIISGGQTGADRAALDFAIAHGIPHGGWCPRGRRAEDGVIHARYGLTETPGAAYAQRTGWNVRDSDGTVVLSIAPRLSGGAAKTVELAIEQRRPWLHLSRKRDGAEAGRRLKRFVTRHRIKILNVAGPRRSEEATVGRFVKGTLENLWKRGSRDVRGATGGKRRL